MSEEPEVLPRQSPRAVGSVVVGKKPLRNGRKQEDNMGLRKVNVPEESERMQERTQLSQRRESPAASPPSAGQSSRTKEVGEEVMTDDDESRAVVTTESRARGASKLEGASLSSLSGLSSLATESEGTTSKGGSGSETGQGNSSDGNSNDDEASSNPQKKKNNLTASEGKKTGGDAWTRLHGAGAPKRKSPPSEESAEKFDLQQPPQKRTVTEETFFGGSNDSEGRRSASPSPPKSVFGEASSRAEAWHPKQQQQQPPSAAAAASAQQQQQRSPWKKQGQARMPSSSTVPLRKGKWTIEEEMYTSAIIREFERGMLNCAPGTTLRSFLSDKLHCDPMRITKKFAGDASIGKRVFTPCKHTPDNANEVARVRAELEDVERRFLSHLQRNNLGSSAPGGFSASATTANPSASERTTTTKARSRANSASSLAVATVSGTVPVSAAKQPTTFSAHPAAQSQQQHHLQNLDLGLQQALQQQVQQVQQVQQQQQLLLGPYGADAFARAATRAFAAKSSSAYRIVDDGAPVVVDHTGAVLRGPTERRRQHVDESHYEHLSQQTRLQPNVTKRNLPPYAVYENEGLFLQNSHTTNNGKRRKQPLPANYHLVNNTVANNDRHIRRRFDDDHHYAERGRRQAPVDAAKEEDSKLLLDFFVSVHERCDSESPRRNTIDSTEDEATNDDDEALRRKKKQLIITTAPLTQTRTATSLDGDGSSDRSRR